MVARRRLWVPEVIQTSGMDCGPAALQALLAGFGIATRYARLREACQTDVDGTSIDTLEEVGVELGLDAEQYIVPVDHLLLPEAEALPAVVVTRLPSGLTHFVVAWRTQLGLVQVMDPASGRVFRTRAQLLGEVLVHRLPVERELAREWLAAPAFLAPLRRRLAALGLSDAAVERLIEDADASDEWLPLAALDATTRLATRLVRAKALAAGDPAAEFCRRISREAIARGERGAWAIVPADDWSVLAREDELVELRGVVIVHAEGPREAVDDEHEPSADALRRASSPELAAARGREDASPLRSLLADAFAVSPALLVLLPIALLLAGAATMFEVALLGGLVRLDPQLAARGLSSGRIVTMVAWFLCVILLIELASAALLGRLGRWLDVHLRTRLLAKLPRLGNHYFHSRLSSDLAHRAFELGSLRRLPSLLGEGLRIVGELLAIGVAIAYLVPGSAGLLGVAAVALLGVPILASPLLRDRDLRRETHVGALVRFHLDALRGLLPIRAHRAAPTLRAEHEALLGKWARATRELDATYLGVFALALIGATAFGVGVVNESLRAPEIAGLGLLVGYWALKLPVLSQGLLGLLRQLPTQHNRLARIDEILRGPEESELLGGARREAARPQARAAGVAVEMRGLSVHAGGREILADVELALRPGEHVAIVGASGSGKTSLVGLLLGWHRPSAGALTIDGRPARAEEIHGLRRETAWVDPGVTLWNRSLADNLRYGNGPIRDAELRRAIADAELDEVVARLEQGVDAAIGEAGSMLSGGEGQRVRFARALLRPGVRLCVLDEPFRGLERERRAALLSVARRRWCDATLLYVSHDIDAALEFSRVLVLDGGRVVEDGDPRELLARPGSRLAALHAAREAAAREIWANPIWRRWWMERGELREGEGES